MATTTRYYVPSTGAAAHSPAISSYWLHSESAAKLAAVTAKISSAKANKKASTWAIGTERNLAQQYVAAAATVAHDYTVNDTIEAQLLCIREANTSSGYVSLSVRVFNADCSAVLGVLYEGTAPTNIPTADDQNRALVAGGGHVHVQNSVSAPVGSHLVFEVGFTSTATAAWAGSRFEVGDNQSGDYPVDETTTAHTYDAWIEVVWADAGYTLAVDPGSYALSGQAVGTLAGRKAVADAGAYSLSGLDVSVLFGRKVGADTGAYTLIGQDATLLRAARIAAESGLYVLTGLAADILFGRKIGVEAGGYVLTGQDIALLRAARIGADGGTYVLSGQDVGLFFNRLILADTGSYVLTGQDVTLVYTPGGGAYIITADGGTYAVTGQVAGLLKANKLSLEAGAYVLTGQAINALFGRRLGADGGSYGIAGASGGVLRRWTGTAWATVNVFVRYGG